LTVCLWDGRFVESGGAYGKYRLRRAPAEGGRNAKEGMAFRG